MGDTTSSKSAQLPEHVSDHFRRHLQSGLSIQAYCKQANISAWSFYSWRKRYRVKTSGRRRQKAVTFESLGTLSLQQPRFDLRFPSGMSISVYCGTTVEEVAPFITLMSGTSVQC